MAYFQFTLDGRFVIEAESLEKAKNKIHRADTGYIKAYGEVEPDRRKCKLCGKEFETFSRDQYCSSKCYWKSSDGFYWDEKDKEGYIHNDAKHDEIKDNELAKKKGLI